MNQTISRRGAIALIVKNNTVLMGKKCHRPGHFLSDAWHFPGGKAEENEAIEDTLIREMWEELGMKFKVIRKFCEYILTFGDSSSHSTVFICESDDEPVPNDDLVDAEYFVYEDILRLHHKESFDRLPDEVKEYLAMINISNH